MYRLFTIALILLVADCVAAQEQVQRKRVVGMSTRQGMRQGSYARFYRSSRGVVVNQQEVVRGQLARPEDQAVSGSSGDNVEGSLERKALERRGQLRHK